MTLAKRSAIRNARTRLVRRRLGLLDEAAVAAGKGDGDGELRLLEAVDEMTRQIASLDAILSAPAAWDRSG
ncbi:MAG TPA: hypothetical protein VHP37_15250 [Burkholderiales bacterium]|nr:hypothetical protein [Burkholderiales bacterium]